MIKQMAVQMKLTAVVSDPRWVQITIFPKTQHTTQAQDGPQKCKRVSVREKCGGELWRVRWAQGHRVRWRCG